MTVAVGIADATVVIISAEAATGEHARLLGVGEANRSWWSGGSSPMPMPVPSR